MQEIQTAHVDAHRSASLEKGEHGEDWSYCWPVFGVEAARGCAGRGKKMDGNCKFWPSPTPSNPPSRDRISLAKPCRQRLSLRCNPRAAQRGSGNCGLTGTPPSLGVARVPRQRPAAERRIGIDRLPALSVAAPASPSTSPVELNQRGRGGQNTKDLIQKFALSERLENRQAAHARVVKTAIVL